ncbi:retrovirus-related pol polyprotein from transposon TNT 1-94 [Tanacetum coccineum]|uniref:Retrovirus-related pol polyprotein from transposon TNT 1-94 n=1 Tax=Tanacetum coccineum TaxID=301880 RepID=A0ABQ4XB59_9ASTR
MLSATPKLLSGIEDSHHGPSDAMHNPPQPFKKDSILQAGNPVKEILLKLNLPDHRSILTDSKICIKMVWSDEVLKLKTSRKVTIKAFNDQEKYEHVGPKVTSAQDGKCLQVDNKRLCLVDDLKKLKDHLQVKQAKSLKSKSTSIYHKIKEIKTASSRLKTKHSMLVWGKSKKHSHKPKTDDTNQEKLFLLHMDLCGLMRVQSVNGKKYILVIVDDYSRFTWVKFLTSKDEAPDFIIKFLKMIQV